MIRFFGGNLLIGVLALAALLAGTPAHADIKALEEAARKESAMTWYITVYGTEIAEEVAAAFAKHYPALNKIKVVRTTSGTGFQRLNQDLKNHVNQAGVFTSTDVAGQYELLVKAGAFANYVPENATKIDPAYGGRGEPGYVYPVCAGMFALAYNTNLVKPEEAPHSWQDLLDPKWKGKVALGHPAFSGFDAAWNVAMVKMVGWSYFEKLEKNSPLIQRSTFDVLATLAAGERAVAATAEGNILDAAARGNPVAVFYPSDGSVVIPGYTGILKDTAQPATARLFTEFLLTVEHGQIMVAHHYYSARPEVAPLKGGKTLAELKLAPALTSQESAATLKKSIEDWRNLFGD